MKLKETVLMFLISGFFPSLQSEVAYLDPKLFLHFFSTSLLSLSHILANFLLLFCCQQV